MPTYTDGWSEGHKLESSQGKGGEADEVLVVQVLV